MIYINNIKQSRSRTSSVACFRGHYFDIVFTQFSLFGVSIMWSDLDLKWPWCIPFFMFIFYSCHIQVYFHQVEPNLNMLKFDLTLTFNDLGWSCSLCFILLSHSGLFSPHLNQIWASWSFTWPWPMSQPITSRIIFTKFEPDWSKLKFNLTFDLGALTLRASEHLTNITFQFFGQSCTHTTKQHRVMALS